LPLLPWRLGGSLVQLPAPRRGAIGAGYRCHRNSVSRGVLGRLNEECMTYRWGRELAQDEARAAANAAMARYAAGDDRAFSQLYGMLAPSLQAYLLRRTRDASRAEDLLQHVFLKIHLARRRFWREGEVMPWALAIARRLLIDSFRGRCRECLLDSEDGLCVEQGTPAGRHLEELIRRRDLLHRIEHELANLPDNYRVAFELVQLEGLTMAEAAETLGTTVNTVKCRAHRAYKALRERLGPAVADGV
jgi:RNA polymerase sigma-70 factor (ECF subfamily)